MFLPPCDEPNTCHGYSGNRDTLPVFDFDSDWFDHNITRNYINNTEDSAVTMSEYFASLSHQQEDFFLRCIWQGSEVCDAAIQPILTEMGQCWTFNTNVTHPLLSDRTGEQNGVEFWINVESYEQFQNFDDDSGIKVHLHPQDDIPQVADQGFAIPVGTHCLAPATYTRTKSLPYPKGNCRDKPLTTYSTYPRAKCENECRGFFFTFIECGCHPSHLPKMLEGYDECDFNQTINCVDKLVSSGDYDNDVCACEDSCQRNVYGVKLSGADLTGRMLPYVNRTALHDTVQKGVAIKHRLQLEEFGNTIQLLEDLERPTRYFVSALQKFEHKQNYLEQLLQTETMMRQKIIAFHLIELMHLVDRQQETYTHFAKPFIKRSIRVMKNAIEDLFNLQNEAVSKWIKKEENPTLSLQSVRHVAQSLQDALLELKRVVGWHDYAEVLSEKYNTDLNKRLFQSSHCSVHVTTFSEKLEMAGSALGNISANPNNDTLTEAEHRLLLGEENLILTVARISDNFFTCLEEYGSHVEEGSKLKEKVLLLPTTPVIKTQKQELSNIPYYQRLVQDTIECYYKNRCGKSHLASATFSEEINMHIANKIRDAQEQIQQIWFDPILNQWADNKKRSKDLTLKVLQWVNVMIEFHPSLGEDFRQKIQRWDIWKMPRLSSTQTMLLSRTQVDVDSDWNDKTSLKIHTAERIVDAALRDFYSDLNKKVAHISDNIEKLGNRVEVSMQKMTKHLLDFEAETAIDESFIRQNFIRLNVYFGELKYEYIEQQEAYVLSSFFSDIGGYMGLLIGASAITIFELLDLVLYNLFRKCCKDKSKSKGLQRVLSRDSSPPDTKV